MPNSALQQRKCKPKHIVASLLQEHTHAWEVTYQIHSPPYKMISHTRTILTPSSSHQHHAMLLYIVP